MPEDRNVSVEIERDIVTINIRQGKQTRFMDIDIMTAKELLYQLNLIDMWTEEEDG